MINDRTPHLNLPLPHSQNLLSQDVERLREAIGTLDTTLAEQIKKLNAPKPREISGHGIQDLRVASYNSGSCDVIKVAGFYEILNENNRWTNLPSTDRATYSLLVVSSWRAGRNLVQIAYRHDNKQEFKRYYINERWTPWQREDFSFIQTLLDQMQTQLNQVKTLAYAGL